MKGEIVWGAKQHCSSGQQFPAWEELTLCSERRLLKGSVRLLLDRKFRVGLLKSTGELLLTWSGWAHSPLAQLLCLLLLLTGLAGRGSQPSIFLP